MPAYTVTIAGPERHDGEKPYTYVCNAESNEHAVDFVRDHFCREQDTDDVDIVEVTTGVPPANCGYHWNDLREITGSESDRQDFVDSEIGALLDRLCGKELDHDIELIANVRDVIMEEFKSRNIMTEMEFYPYRVLSETDE